MEKIFGVYKPRGITSHDVVNIVRKFTGEKRVGHAGTLDPLAEGVLVVAVTREATRQLSALVKKEKEYVAEIRLGVTSVTDDEEGEKTVKKVALKPDEGAVKEALKKFTGNIMQRPPAYSALKVKGKSAYKLARSGLVVKLEPREVTVKEAELLAYDWPVAKARFVTGQGVYIRALARDFGEALSVGGYLKSLRRTRVGDFTVDNSYSLKHFLPK